MSVLAPRAAALPASQFSLPLPFPVLVNDAPQAGYSALRVIADERFCAWQGGSGRRYVASIYSFETCPDYENVVALAVRRDADGRRTLLDGLDLGACPLVSLSGDAFGRARAAGANEVHLHLLAETAAERQAVLDDLL